MISLRTVVRIVVSVLALLGGCVAHQRVVEQPFTHEECGGGTGDFSDSGPPNGFENVLCVRIEAPPEIREHTSLGFQLKTLFLNPRSVCPLAVVGDIPVLIHQIKPENTEAFDVEPRVRELFAAMVLYQDRILASRLDTSFTVEPKKVGEYVLSFEVVVKYGECELARRSVSKLVTVVDGYWLSYQGEKLLSAVGVIVSFAASVFGIVKYVIPLIAGRRKRHTTRSAPARLKNRSWRSFSRKTRTRHSCRGTSRNYVARILRMWSGNDCRC